MSGFWIMFSILFGGALLAWLSGGSNEHNGSPFC